MDDIRAILESFETYEQNKVVSLYILSYLPHEIRVVLSDGVILYLNQKADYNAAADIFDAILIQEIGNRRKDVAYVDLRFGNKVFYKLRGAQ